LAGKARKERSCIAAEKANAIMKGFEIYYNLITKYQAINKCPYELANHKDRTNIL